MLLSVSRRTDIPAFYPGWFAGRLREGFCLVRNPFNAAQVSRVSLLPADVSGFVFWSKNPAPFLPHLPEVDKTGIPYYFHFTLNGYGAPFETGLPDTQTLIRTFQTLADRVGSNRVIWRYDPVILTPEWGINEHTARFEQLATALNGKTTRVMTSFLQFYEKTRRNLGTHPVVTANGSDKTALLTRMSETAARYGMELFTCAESRDYSSLGAPRGKCIDDELMLSLWGEGYAWSRPPKADKTRPHCFCRESTDIGRYDTCRAGCLYCYANSRPAAGQKKRYDPNSPLLCDELRGDEKITEKKVTLRIEKKDDAGLFD